MEYRVCEIISERDNFRVTDTPMKGLFYMEKMEMMLMDVAISSSAAKISKVINNHHAKMQYPNTSNEPAIKTKTSIPSPNGHGWAPVEGSSYI